MFAADRAIKFEEMEYELPRANGWAALMEAIATIRRKRLPVSFPFEFRLVAGDDIWLSPFNAGPGASISMHQYAKMPWREAFADIEPIFRAAGGRPHWAKRHTLQDAAGLYPKTDGVSGGASAGSIRRANSPMRRCGRCSTYKPEPET